MLFAELAQSVVKVKDQLVDMAPDKVITEVEFFFFAQKNYLLVTYWNHLIEIIPICTDKVFFDAKITKSIFRKISYLCQIRHFFQPKSIDYFSNFSMKTYIVGTH